MLSYSSTKSNYHNKYYCKKTLQKNWDAENLASKSSIQRQRIKKSKGKFLKTYLEQ